MGGKLAIVLGFVVGMVVGAALIGAAIALVPPVGTATPEPAVTAAPVATPSPSAGPATAEPSVSEPSVAPPSGSPVPTPATPAPSAGQSPDASAADAFSIGQPAPPLVLASTSGETIDLGSLKGKPVWVSMMATSCPACRDELPLVQEYAARYEDAGLVVLLVDVKEDATTVQAFLDDLNVYLPAALDTDGSVQRAWGAADLPVHVWIDADGIVRKSAAAGIGPDVMAQGLQAIMPGETVTP
jgi:thiol-disulfide isomerase/thioredoxin